MYRYVRNTALALALSACTAAAVADTAPQSQPAKWVTRDVDFTYQGFTTQYSCDGLRENVESILRKFGARRKDMKVAITPCAGLGNSELSLAPGVRGTISVLVPATAEEVTRGDGGVVQAHWKTVDLAPVRNLDNQWGAQCELLEQSKKGLLPLFTTRNLDFTSNCVPHERFAGGMTFKVDVLQVDRKANVH